MFLIFFQGSEDNKNGSDDEVDLRVNLGHPKKQSTSGLKKSAAGLCVGMGSFSDPEELPGLAHFLEHMVCFVIKFVGLLNTFILLSLKRVI